MLQQCLKNEQILQRGAKLNENELDLDHNNTVILYLCVRR